jgi:hypothetical protein
MTQTDYLIARQLLNRREGEAVTLTANTRRVIRSAAAAVLTAATAIYLQELLWVLLSGAVVLTLGTRR